MIENFLYGIIGITFLVIIIAVHFSEPEKRVQNSILLIIIILALLFVFLSVFGGMK